MSETALAAPEGKPAQSPKYKRLTDSDRAYALRMHAQHVPQVEIAKRIGCHPSSVCEWLKQCDDSRVEASQFLNGNALALARNIVKKGRAADHVAVLKGLSVLKEERGQGVTIQIGIKDSDVSLDLSPLVALTPSESA